MALVTIKLTREHDLMAALALFMFSQSLEHARLLTPEITEVLATNIKLLKASEYDWYSITFDDETLHVSDMTIAAQN